jgi:hypothetical protein
MIRMWQRLDSRACSRRCLGGRPSDAGGEQDHPGNEAMSATLILETHFENAKRAAQRLLSAIQRPHLHRHVNWRVSELPQRFIVLGSH